MGDFWIDGFAWDVELLYTAARNQIGIAEVPVRWKHIEGSKVNPMLDGIDMVRTVLKLRLRAIGTSSKELPKGNPRWYENEKAQNVIHKD